MPRFFFHCEDGDFTPDLDGTNLASVAEAREIAVRVLSERLKGNPALLLTTGAFQVTVTDETNRTVFVVDLTAAPRVALGD